MTTPQIKPDRYDYPLPVLDMDRDYIQIETKDRFEGSFDVRNTGGGVLKGYVFSRCPGLVFKPEEWEGNNRTINFSFSASAAGLRIGETLESHFFVMSTGGERQIPISAKLTKMSLSTSDGRIIANIQDFYDYSLVKPSQARRLFTDSEFYMLLLASGYEYMEVYESLHKDPNRERAMDNFFILSGLKTRTSLELGVRRLEFTQRPGEMDMMYGQFQVRKTDNGYVEAPVTVKEESPWLTLSSGKLSASDFNEEYAAVINFSIDPTRIPNLYAREQVVVGAEPSADGSNIVEIVYRRKPSLQLRLNRDAYRYDDKGTINVVNNTGINMQVEVFCPESYIRFAARRFPVGAYGEIPFNIKLSAFMSAQLFFRKLPFLKTVIEIRATVPGQIHKKSLPIVVGEW